VALEKIIQGPRKEDGVRATQDVLVCGTYATKLEGC